MCQLKIQLVTFQQEKIGIIGNLIFQEPGVEVTHTTRSSEMDFH